MKAWGLVALGGLSLGGCGAEAAEQKVATLEPSARPIPVIDLHVDLAYALTEGRGASESAGAPGLAPSGVGAPGLAPSGVDIPGLAPSGVGASGLAPSGVGASGLAPSGVGASGLAPSGSGAGGPSGAMDGAVSAERLRRGGVVGIVVPLFVTGADAMSPVEARSGYERAFSAMDRAWASGWLARPGARGGVATVLAFEGADGFAGDLPAIDRWVARGARLFGIVHQRTNRLAGSSQDPQRALRGVGLTAEGEAVVRRVYAAGGLVDVAHASDAAFDDVARIAREVGMPIVDSHTGVRALVDIERNIDDGRLRTIAESGGVVGIDLHSGHIAPQPGDTATLRDVADHLEHAARIAGFDHVGIGSDLEGGIEPPVDADGEATWPKLAGILREHGWSEAQIEAVFSGNARRVLAVTSPR